MKCQKCESDCLSGWEHFCPFCGFELFGYRTKKKSAKGIDVVHVLAEDLPRTEEGPRCAECDTIGAKNFSEHCGNTTVDCPTCGEKHSWPACEGNVKRERDTYTKAEIDERLKEVLSVVWDISILACDNNDASLMMDLIDALRSRFLSDKTTR